MSIPAVTVTLAGTIDAYHAALADFNANSPQGSSEAADAYAVATFRPWLAALESWDKPATTQAEAVAALGVALNEADDFHSAEPVVPMIRAALAYMDASKPDLAQIEALIDAHRASWLGLETACEATDNAFRTDAQAAAEEAQAKASDATFQAIWSIIEHPYSSLDELKRAMAYLVEHHRATGDGNLGEWLLGFACHLAGVSEEEAA